VYLFTRDLERGEIIADVLCPFSALVDDGQAGLRVPLIAPHAFTLLVHTCACWLPTAPTCVCRVCRACRACVSYLRYLLGVLVLLVGLVEINQLLARRNVSHC
jgi:hypothetical protein